MFVFGGSDAHRPDCIGLGYTEFAGPVTCESDLIRLIKERGRAACTCGGEYFEGTTKNKIGKANNILVQSFWLYNHACSIIRRHKRRLELKKFYIRIK